MRLTPQASLMVQLIQHASSPFKVELFLLSNDPHDQARFQRRVAVNAYERQIWLPTAEDVIIHL
jgi:hypothetical protein